MTEEARRTPLIRATMKYLVGRHEFFFETDFPQDAEKQTIFPIIDKIQSITAREGIKLAVVQKREQLEAAKIQEQTLVGEHEAAAERLQAAQEKWSLSGDRRPFRPSPSDKSAMDTNETSLKTNRETIDRLNAEIKELLGLIDEGKDECPSMPHKSSISVVR